MKIGWLILAALLIGARFTLGQLGGAEATRFLAGNAADPGQILLGASYVLTHLAAIVIAPILVLGALLERGLNARS